MRRARGPGVASDTFASVIYKQYHAGFYGLSTAGTVVLFILIAALVVPQLMSYPDEARMTRAQQDIQALRTALDLYRMDNFSYPMARTFTIGVDLGL